MIYNMLYTHLLVGNLSHKVNSYLYIDLLSTITEDQPSTFIISTCQLGSCSYLDLVQDSATLTGYKPKNRTGAVDTVLSRGSFCCLAARKHRCVIDKSYLKITQNYFIRSVVSLVLRNHDSIAHIQAIKLDSFEIACLTTALIPATSHLESRFKKKTFLTILTKHLPIFQQYQWILQPVYQELQHVLAPIQLIHLLSQYQDLTTKKFLN